MAVGRPIKLTPNVARKSITVTATEGQTSFTPTGGYRINELGVFRNGVRLVQGKDFTASDGSTVTLLSGCTVDDVVEFQIWDSFNIVDAISANGDQVMGGDLTVGLTTMYSGTTGIVSTGELRATTLYGDGSNLTGVAGAAVTAYIDSINLTASGIVSFTNTTDSTSSTTGAVIISGGVGIAKSLFVGNNVTIGGTVTYEDVTNVDSVGIITAQTGVIVTAGRGVQITAGGLNVAAGVGTFKGVLNADAEVTAAGGVDVAGGLKVGAASTLAAVSSSGVVNLTNTTDSTSSTTGALIISGGVGIAKSLFVGNNVTIGGTLTYEDVTNIDSVGLITARTGVRVTAGGLVVTAGITTVGAGLSLADNIKARFGTSGDLEIYHSGSESHIREQGTGGLILNSSVTTIKNPGDTETIARFTENGGVDLNFDNSTKLATTNTGVVVTGVATASDYYIGVGGTSVHTALGTKASTGKAIAMAMVFG